MSVLLKVAEGLPRVRHHAAGGAGIGAVANTARQHLKNKDKEDDEKGSLLGAAAKGGAVGGTLGAGVGAARKLPKFREQHAKDLGDAAAESHREHLERMDRFKEQQAKDLSDAAAESYVEGLERVISNYKSVEEVRSDGEGRVWDSMQSAAESPVRKASDGLRGYGVDEEGVVGGIKGFGSGLKDTYDFFSGSEAGWS